MTQFHAALAFIDELCAREDVHAADFFCGSARINRHFVAAGWFSALDDVWLKIPNLFHPLELREPSSTPLMYWSREDVSELADLLKLYITKKDIDFDRPVFSTLQ
jgi:hypothetical protein